MSKDHQPSLDPAVDILHAVERGSVMSEPQNPPPVVPQRHASASKLETGARVRVHSLQSAKSQKYNGQEGVLGDMHEDELRWYVQLSNGVSISCKPDNLEFIRAAEKKPQQSGSGSSGEEAVKRKVKKYSAILMHVAFCSATQGQAILGQAGGMAGALTSQVTQMIDHWERAGKSAHRKTIATVLKRILEGASDIERLRPHHPPWTKLEEACVKKVFEYKCMPYTDLLLKAKGLESDDFASSGDEHSRGEEAERKAAGAERSRDPQSGRSQAGSDVSGGLDATVDPYEWMHPCLARLLPESMQSNEQLWNGTISALKAADVRSEEQLDAMSSEDLKRIPMPLTVRAYLVNNRKSGERLIAQATLSEGTERGEEKEEKTDQMKPDEAEAAATATTDTGPEKEVQNFSAAVSAKAEGLENKSVKELREMCKAQIYKNVRSIVIFFSKYTRALTFENLWKEQGPRLLVVRRQA